MNWLKMQATLLFSVRAFLALPIAGGLALGAAYHISPTGDDAAKGTAAKPWKSVSRANSQRLRPGDRLLFQGGASFLGNLVLRAEDAGTPTKPVIIGSYGNGKAHIEAGAGSGVLVENAGGIEIENLVVSGAGRLNNAASGIKVIHNLPEARRVKHIRIRDVEASGFGRAGIFVAGLATDGTQSGFDDVRIERCDAHDNVYYGIIAAGRGMTTVRPALCQAIRMRGVGLGTRTATSTSVIAVPGTIKETLITGAIIPGAESSLPTPTSPPSNTRSRGKTAPSIPDPKEALAVSGPRDQTG